jgi:hypothetical protein
MLEGLRHERVCEGSEHRTPGKAQGDGEHVVAETPVNARPRTTTSVSNAAHVSHVYLPPILSSWLSIRPGTVVLRKCD